MYPKALNLISELKIKNGTSRSLGIQSLGLYLKLSIKTSLYSRIAAQIAAAIPQQNISRENLH